MTMTTMNGFFLNWNNIVYLTSSLLRDWFFADYMHGNEQNLASVDMEFLTKYQNTNFLMKRHFEKCIFPVILFQYYIIILEMYI